MSGTIMGFQSQFHYDPKPPKLNPEDHNPIDQDSLEDAIKASLFGDGSTGFCASCGYHHVDNLEPDTQNYTCDLCDLPQVFAAEELLQMGYLKED